MTRYDFKILLDAVRTSPEVKEATADELRVLLALIARDGNATKEELAAGSGVSAARIAAAVTLWVEAGILVLRDTPTVTEEFEERIRPSEIAEESALEVAAGIRDNKLRDLLDTYATMMNKAVLKPHETKQITGLVTQYGLSPEYIATYMSHLHERGRLSGSAALVNGAIKLHEAGITTEERLTVYLAELEEKTLKHLEIRKLIGIYGRKLSASEESYFDKWTKEFGYGISVIGEAYDITALNTGKASLPYMDALLSGWHEAGAVSVDDCREIYEKKAEEERARAKRTEGSSKRAAKEKPRYGDFDPEEAMRNALMRSTFADDEDDEA